MWSGMLQARGMTGVLSGDVGACIGGKGVGRGVSSRGTLGGGIVLSSKTIWDITVLFWRLVGPKREGIGIVYVLSIRRLLLQELFTCAGHTFILRLPQMFQDRVGISFLVVSSHLTTPSPSLDA